MTSDVEGLEVAFLVEAGGLMARFSIKNAEQESARIKLEITIDSKTSEVTAHEIEVGAGFVGLCNHYFENAQTIRQANHVPEGTICSLNVSVRGDGELLAEVPVALQYAGCSGEAEWRTIKIENTGTGKSRGFAEINFEFIDSAEYCRYRVVAPYYQTKTAPLVYPIDTFTEQEYYKDPSFKTNKRLLTIVASP